MKIFVTLGDADDRLMMVTVATNWLDLYVTVLLPLLFPIEAQLALATPAVGTASRREEKPTSQRFQSWQKLHD